jgi:hypothetical protein
VLRCFANCHCNTRVDREALPVASREASTVCTIPARSANRNPGSTRSRPRCLYEWRRQRPGAVAPRSCSSIPDIEWKDFGGGTCWWYGPVGCGLSRITLIIGCSFSLGRYPGVIVRWFCCRWGVRMRAPRCGDAHCYRYEVSCCSPLAAPLS